MDPLGTVQTLISVVNYLYEVVEKVKENKEECARLCSHVELLAKSIESEYADGTIPPKLNVRLESLTSILTNITETVEELAKRPYLQMAIWRKTISSKVQDAYRDLRDAMEIFRLGTTIDLAKVLQENEEGRRLDAEKTNKYFEQSLQNDGTIIRALEVQKEQMQEAMLSLYKYLPGLSQQQTTERVFLERGLYAMQRRSGRLKIPANEHVITSMDVIIKYDKKLGEGGFAAVYEGDWKGTKVAVKVLEKGVPASTIQQEIDVWSRLRHPHILQFYGACSIANPPFIVCAFQENGDVTSYLRQYPRVSKSKLLYQALIGLVYLHDNDIVHGDLKASNILVDEHGIPCLADFGLSRIKSHTTTMGAMQPSQQGTIRWMAPEHITFGICTTKADVYSFGMTMYEVFTGIPPFAGTPDNVLLTIVCDRGTRPPRPELEELGDDMWNLMTVCWSQQPSGRPKAQQIADTMKTIVDQQPDLDELGAGLLDGPALPSPMPDPLDKEQIVMELLKDNEGDVLRGLVELKKKTLKSIMTPIEDILTIPTDMIVDGAAVDKLFSSGFSQIPVHEPDKPLSFIGLLDVKELVRYDPATALTVSTFRLSVLPETNPSVNCFQAFDYVQTGRAALLLVSTTPGVAGGAIGVVTREDIVEAMMGVEAYQEE